MAAFPGNTSLGPSDGNFSVLEIYNEEESNGSSKFHFLQQNCRDNWPTWTCIVGNVSGLCSTVLWFLVLLPQLWKNYRRKSVKGLSVLWATANFTASLVNLFFVFMYASIPIYGQIIAVYCPVLELLLLVQFWVYGHQRILYKVLYLCACILLWITVIAVEFLFSVEGSLEYVAIGLWCTQTYPQVMLNMKLQSTKGQSFKSVLIAMLGKTTDFTCNNVLVLPLQYVIMTYFSSSVAYVNGLQIAWYYGNNLDGDQPMRDLNSGNDENQTQAGESLIDGQSLNSSISVTKFWSAIGFRRVSPKADAVRIIGLCLLTCLLTTCVVGFVWNIQSYYGLFAPVSIAIVLVVARSYIWCYRRDKCFARRMIKTDFSEIDFSQFGPLAH